VARNCGPLMSHLPPLSPSSRFFFCILADRPAKRNDPPPAFYPTLTKRLFQHYPLLARLCLFFLSFPPSLRARLVPSLSSTPLLQVPAFCFFFPALSSRFFVNGRFARSAHFFLQRLGPGPRLLPPPCLCSSCARFPTCGFGTLSITFLSTCRCFRDVPLSHSLLCF